MDQTVLRPKPMPGREPGRDEPEDARPPGTAARRPHAAPPGRRKRLTTLLLALGAALLLLLAGIGLGTVCATVLGMSRSAEPPGRPVSGASEGIRASSASTRSDAARQGPGDTVPLGGADGPGSRDGAPAPAVRAGARPALGIEAVDAPRGAGAYVVGVHVPGPGHAAGLVRGDVLLAFGGTRLASAADLARAVASARPGTPIALAVRHADGTRQQLTATPGVTV
jgi:membrane-associated protease RseP (regulator of RpoE activity)